jgi:outer membrane protein
VPVVPPTPTPSASPTLLNLSDAQKIALAQSPALAAARAAVDQAQGSVGIATSGALPNLNAQASSDRSRFSVRTGSGTVPILLTSNTASVNLKQLIFDGGRVGQQIKAAKYSSSAARFQLQRQVQTVLFGVAQSYFQALQARHQLITARDSLRLAQTQLKLVEAQFRAGVAARADVITAQLPVAQAELAIAQAANGEQTQVATLLNVMGLPSNTPTTIADDTSIGGTIPPLGDVLTIANNARPDLLAARETRRSAEANVGAARAQSFPNISGTAGDGTSSTALNGGTFVPTWALGVSVSVPVFDGGLIHAQTQSALAQLDTARANERAAELTVSLNAQQAYLGLQTARAGLSSATVELSQAHTVLDVTNAQYRAGVTTLPLLLNAQVGLTKAETDYAIALYNFKIAQQQLSLAEGMTGS